MSLTEAFLAAMLVAVAGAGHCLGMCGAISVSLGFAVPETGREGRALLRWHLLFATGRLMSYSLLGLIAGTLGQALQVAIPGGGRLAIGVAAVVMALSAIALLGRDLGLQKLERIGMALWRRIQPWLQPLIPVRHAWQALLVGMGWGLLPCGLVYTALLMAAAAGTPLAGALLMFGFGLVTVVPVTGTGLVAGSMPWLRNRPWRWSGAALGLMFAAWLLAQALGGHAAPHDEPHSLPRAHHHTHS